MNTKRTFGWQRLEALAPLLLFLLFGFTYNEIGQLAELRGIDYGPTLSTSLDAGVPLVPLMMLPYAVFWFLPLLAMGYLYWKRGWEPAPYRRIFVALAVLMLSCSTLWVLVPVHVGLRADHAVLADHGILGRWISLTYLAASEWNACPSFHVAGSWFLCRVVRLYRPHHTKLFPLVVTAIIASTVLIRIHYLADIVFGLAISELVYRFVLHPMESRKALEHIPSARAAACSMGILAVGFAGYALLLGI